MKKISIAVVSCLACMPCAMAAVPNDFDGDGISDRTWVQIEADKSLTWTAELSTSQAQMALGSLGKAGDGKVIKFTEFQTFLATFYPNKENELVV